MNSKKTKRDPKNRYFAFTLNNYTAEDESTIQSWAENCTDLHHIIYAKEVGKEGTPHLQGAIAFKINKQKRALAVKNDIGITTLHIEICKKYYQANVNYCIKAKTPEEQKNKFIWQYPIDYFKIKSKTNSKKQTKNEVYELAKNGDFDKIEGQYWLTMEKQIMKTYCNNIKVEKLFYDQGNGKNYFKTFNCLLWGPTGTGKSFRIDLIVDAINNWWKVWCQTKNKPFKELEVYYKQQMKWWDGYIDQKIVVIEELEPSWVIMAQSKLKIWLDSNPFPVETKGGTLDKIRPWFFILTSNYDLEDLCGFGKEDYNPKILFEPLKRRICCIKVNNFNQSIDFPNYSLLFEYFSNIDEVKYNYKLESLKFINNLQNNFEYQKIISNQIENTRTEEQASTSDLVETEPILLSDNEELTEVIEGKGKEPIEEEPRQDYVYVEDLPGYSQQVLPPRKKSKTGY